MTNKQWFMFCVTAIIVVALAMGCPIEQIIKIIPALLGIGM